MRKRSIRHRGKRGKRKVLDLDITSLLDILVIMLVFLLKSYNSSGVIINVPDDIELPISESESLNTTGINIKVTPKTIHVDDKMVYQESDSPKKLHQMEIIYPLYNELVHKKETIKQIEKMSSEAKKFSGLINLIIDKSIRYNIMQKLMYTSATAGFKTFKFVVMGQDN